MQNVIDTAVSFPAVIFTVSTVFFLGFWLATTLLGAGINSLDDFDFDFDGDADLDVDADLDADVSGENSGGLLRASLEFLGITGMPILLALNLLSIFSWATVMIALTVIGDGAGPLVGLVLAVGAFLLGGFVTGRIAKRFDNVFVPTPAIRRQQLVGRMCTITTTKVTDTFGQAEVRDDEGGSMVIQVRSEGNNALSTGDRALIFDLDRDEGVFQVTADTGLEM